MKRWEAQPDNLATQIAVELLERSIDALTVVARAVGGPKRGPTDRAAMRRQLSGVLADVETVRQAIRE